MSAFTHRNLINGLTRRMELAGLNQKHLALQAGLNETAVRDILKGRSKDPQYSTLRAVAIRLGCEVEDLYKLPARADFGLADRKAAPWPANAGLQAQEVAPSPAPKKRGRPRKDASASSAAAAPQTAAIGELDLSRVRDSGSVLDGRRARKITRSEWNISPAALAELRLPAGSADSLRLVRVEGSEMAPDFQPGDRILIDTQSVSPSPAGVFLVWDGVGFILRRCEIVPASKPVKVSLRARNPEYGAHDVALKDIQICGRVVAKWQKV